MATKSTVKVPGKKKGGKGTITIPGTKIKAPRELAILAGGGILAALFFMRGSEEEREGGIPSGILAEEIAQRFASERESMTGAIEDINQRLFDLEGGRLADEFLPEPDQPRPRGDRIPDAPAYASGTFEQPTTTFPFLYLSDVETPREEISFGTSEAQTRADLRRGAAYTERAEAWTDRDVSAKPKYKERSVAELISIAKKPEQRAGISIAKKPEQRAGISAAQQRADIRRGSAYAERQAATQRKAQPKATATPKPRTTPQPTARAVRKITEADERFLENLPSWY